MSMSYNPLVSNIPAIPPLIPESTNYSTNYSDKLQVQSIITTELTDGISTLSGGRLTGLLDPIELQDAANKSFADQTIVSYIPASPFNSVQFSSTGAIFGTYVFGANSSLTFNETTLTVAGIRIGSTTTGLLIANGTIDNLNDPVQLQDPATKNYVDNFFLLNTNNITNTGGVSYTGPQMVGSIIKRSGMTSTVSDTTASAGSIITEISGSVGTSVSFYLKNMSSVYNIELNAGSGVSFNSVGPIIIRPNYQLSAYMIIDSIGPDAVTIYITDLNYMKTNSNFVIGNRSMNVSTNILRCTDNFIFNTSDNLSPTLFGPQNSIYSVQNAVYAPHDISGIIYRNYSGLKIDMFDTVSSFISGILPSTGSIDYLFSTGAVEVVIKNISPSGSITITSNGWILDPNSNMTIGPGQTGIFYMHINVATSVGHIYTVGIN